MFDVQRWTSTVLRVHVPFLSWSYHFASAFHAFYQKHSPRFGHSQAEDMEGNSKAWRAIDTVRWGLLHVQTACAVMMRPYCFNGILVFHLRYTNILPTLLYSQ
jgi:hypothetical protein